MNNVIHLDKATRENTTELTLSDIEYKHLGTRDLQTDEKTGLILPRKGTVITGTDDQGIQHWGEATGELGPRNGAIVVVKRLNRNAEVYRELVKWRVA